MAGRPNIGRTLGATYPVGASQVVLFVPDRNREGALIDQDDWVDQALAILGKLFRGATAFPPGRGVWRDDDAGEKMLKEQTVMVVSYVDPKLLTAHTLRSLREFLHRLGRETQQGEVGIVIDSKYYGYHAMTSQERRRRLKWQRKWIELEKPLGRQGSSL